MQFDKLSKTGLAPERGYAYACFRSCVEFGQYYMEEKQIRADFLDKPGDMLLEIHLFDCEQEYRAIRRRDGTYIECLISDESMQEAFLEMGMGQEGFELDMLIEYPCFYGEDVDWGNTNEKKVTLIDKHVPKTFHFPIGKNLLEQAIGRKEGLCLKVVNYITYDENDMIKIPSYRLAGLYVGKNREVVYG